MIEFIANNWLAVLGIILTILFGIFGLTKLSEKRKAKFKNNAPMDNSVVLQNSDGNNIFLGASNLAQLNNLGEYRAVEKVLNDNIDGLVHPTHPKEYKIGVLIFNDRIHLYSKPKNAEAIKKFPQKLITSIFPPSIEDYPHVDEYTDYELYAFNTQKTIKLKIKDYEQYIGDIIDPYPLLQRDDESITPTIDIKPYATFPAARASRIACGFFELSTQMRRIPDPRKNVIAMTNDEDFECDFSLKFVLHLGSSKIDVEFSLLDDAVSSTQARYLNLLFYQEIKSGKKLIFYDESFDSPVFEGNVTASGEIENLSILLEQYKGLLIIEKNLNIKFSHTKEEQITWANTRLIQSICLGFSDEYYEQEIVQYTIPPAISKQFDSNAIVSLNKVQNIASVRNNDLVELLDYQFKIAEQVDVVENFMIDNLHGVLDAYERGDPDITITLIPKDKSKMLLKRKITIKDTQKRQ